MYYYLFNGKQWLRKFDIELGTPIADEYVMAVGYPNLELAKTACNNANRQSPNVWQIVDSKGTIVE